MLISHSHKFIFIKTKKTAGSSIEAMICEHFFDPSIDMCTGSPVDGTPRVNVPARVGMEPDGHRPSNAIKNLVTREQWHTYHKFTVERNPWDKMASDFYWKKRGGLFNDDVPDATNFRKYMDATPNPPCDWLLYTDNDVPVVDTIVRYETLQDDLLNLFNNVLKLPLTSDIITGTRKKSGLRKKHYSELFKRQSDIDKVANMFAKEIKYFGYQY